MNLQQEIISLKKRNEKVEEEKAWETSITRKIIISLFTYFTITLFFFSSENSQPFISAIVPTLGFIISTLSFPFFKRFWEQYIYKK